MTFSDSKPRSCSTAHLARAPLMVAGAYRVDPSGRCLVCNDVMHDDSRTSTNHMTLFIYIFRALESSLIVIHISILIAV